MASYEADRPGREHDLVLVFKGFPAPVDTDPYLERAADSRPRALHVDDAGLDLTAYLMAAERLSHPMVALRTLSARSLPTTGWNCSARRSPQALARPRHRVVGRWAVLQALSGGAARRLRGRLSPIAGPCAWPCMRSTAATLPRRPCALGRQPHLPGRATSRG